MDSALTSQIIAAGSAILGGVIGSIATYLSSRRIENMKLEKEREAFKSGFLSEVNSLILVIKERGYLEQFEEFITHPEIVAGHSIAFYQILIPKDYARFYNANMSKVGLLEPHLATHLIIFHQLLQAVVQDFDPDSFMSKNGFPLTALKEDFRLLSKAVETGETLVQHLPKY